MCGERSQRCFGFVVQLRMPMIVSVFVLDFEMSGEPESPAHVEASVSCWTQRKLSLGLQADGGRTVAGLARRYRRAAS